MLSHSKAGTKGQVLSHSKAGTRDRCCHTPRQVQRDRCTLQGGMQRWLEALLLLTAPRKLAFRFNAARLRAYAGTARSKCRVSVVATCTSVHRYLSSRSSSKREVSRRASYSRNCAVVCGVRCAVQDLLVHRKKDSNPNSSKTTSCIDSVCSRKEGEGSREQPPQKQAAVS